MRHSIFAILAINIILSCKAQVIEPTYKSTDYGTNGVYYKDLDNDFNVFEGTWIYNENNIVFTMILQKKEMKHINEGHRDFYIDAIVGEVSYIAGGIEKINTLSNLTQNTYYYTIEGNIIFRYGDLSCHDCTETNEKVVICDYSESNCEGAPMTLFRLRYYTENGIEKLSCYFRQDGYIFPDSNGELPECTTYKVPYGEYTFVKQ